MMYSDYNDTSRKMEKQTFSAWFTKRARVQKKKKKKLVLDVNVRMPLTCSCCRRCGVCEDRDRQELLHSSYVPLFPSAGGFRELQEYVHSTLVVFSGCHCAHGDQSLLLLFSKLFLLGW